MRHPVIITHRSRASDTLENARSSLRQAANDGADLIELDVRLTLDRQPVVLHDAMLGRTTTGHGPVSLWPMALLSRLHLHGGDGERIPTVADMLTAAPAGVQLALHLKDRRALPGVLRRIQHADAAARCWLWLERMVDVYTATRVLPELRCTLLRPAAWTPGRRGAYFHDTQAAGGHAVSVPSGAVSPDLVAHAHQHHLLVFSRVDHPHLLPELLANGLDGVITSHTRETFATLQRLGHR